MGRRTLSKDEKEYIKRYDAWEKERWELKGSRTGETLALKEDEKFIPVWLPEKRTVYGMYVSQYGNVVSFRKKIKGEWIQGWVEPEGYIKVKDVARVHVIVFWSCLTDMIKALQKVAKKEDIREFFTIIANNKDARISDINELANYIKKNDLVIHHKDYNKQNNKLENLQLLDKETHDALEKSNYTKIKMDAFYILEAEKFKALIPQYTWISKEEE